jgi:predicted class III extradiol MEMO1 family dioxygenase
MNKTSTLKIMNLGINSEDLLHYANGEQQEEPRQHVIDNLLRFSKSLEVKNSSMVGKIENVTN